MKTIRPFVAFFAVFFFASCESEKIDLDLKDLYQTLPETEYVSQNYSVNGMNFDGGKKTFNPPNLRTGENPPKYIKYKDEDLGSIYNSSLSSLIIMFAVDTEIGDVCSVYDSQASVGQLVYINGKLIETEEYYSLIDLKINIKEEYFIFIFANPARKKYVLYKP